MTQIFCDFERLSTNLNSKHTSIGNMVLHVYFVINYAEKHGMTPVIKSGVNISNLFSFKDSVIQEDGDSFKFECAFDEINPIKKPSIFRRILTKLTGKFLSNQSLLELHSGDYDSFLASQSFLNDSNFDHNQKYIRGHFWHYELMPSLKKVSKYLDINDTIKSEILSKYDSITKKNSVAVHFRGGDYRLPIDGLHIYKKGIILSENYYQLAIKEVYKKIKNPVFHLFSDEIQTLEAYFKDHNYIVHNGDSYEDWTAISICHNSIQSNSSFSWTASLFTQGLSIQPQNGLAFNYSCGSFPYGFKHKRAISILNTTQ
jgi:hypothetical protein